MGMSVGGDSDSVVSEINVTPLVDVMLVLLIIFMIAAPMLVQGVDVNLPQVTAKAMDSQKKRLVITLTEDRSIYLDEIKVEPENLASKIEAVLKEREDDQVYLRADSEVPYGFVVGIMADLRKAGVEKLGMVTDPVGSQKDGEEKKAGGQKKKAEES